MNRTELKHYILENYQAELDHPWAAYPHYEVFRHTNNRKWFALIMDIPRNRLGLPGEAVLDVVNLKCDSILIGSLLGEPGFFPAYHMNKENWITVALDDDVPDETMKMLLDVSYAATAQRGKRQRGAVDLTLDNCGPDAYNETKTPFPQ